MDLDTLFNRLRRLEQSQLTPEDLAAVRALAPLAPRLTAMLDDYEQLKAEPQPSAE